MGAKSVVEIWLWGGPSQLESFDPKPDAPRDYNGGFKSIGTVAPAITLHEWWPELAKVANLFSVVRTLTHKDNGHETATYLMQTGRAAGNGETCPAIGAVISSVRRKSYSRDLPPYVILTRAKGRFSEVGFLGEAAAPLVTGGNPNASRFAVEGIVSPADITPAAETARFDLLSKLDRFRPSDLAPANREVSDAFDSAGVQARQIIGGDAAKTFDLSSEPASVREAYGRTEVGQSLLAARRLVEYGVPYVTVNLSGWDSHKKHFETMKKRSGETDRAVAALLADLKAKGLIDSTLVWMSGEFGRTPKIGWEAPWNGGRGHYAKCFSALVAGGGFRGGSVVGESDRYAATVAKRPVSPQDFLGSIYELAGIDPKGCLPNDRGRTMPLLPPSEGGGLLHEIYA